jgi:glycosyltransferase involved in cell wall biosynthesis
MTAARRPRVVILRGHQMNSWHIRPWRHLADRYEVIALQTRSNWFDTGAIGIETRRVRALRDLLPPGRAGQLLSRVPGDRYLDLGPKLADADIVHSQDLGFWYSMQAAKHRAEHGYKLVLTVWETIPFLDAYRNVRTRPYRRRVLAETDLFLAATERARQALLIEGAPAERIRICPPGVDLELFGAAAAPDPPPAEHLIVSPGRLVWEKGHQDVLRAVAALRRGIVAGASPPRVVIVGAGPEEGRLRRYAGELEIADLVEIRPEVPYGEMPALYARASCLVLGSLPVWFWEEQFGMVLAEALASRLPIVAAASGAIPEVLRDQAPTFAPGDWPALARLLAGGPLSRRPGERARYDAALVEEYSSVAFAERLGSAYDELLGPKAGGEPA